jgi:hypothetical protein
VTADKEWPLLANLDVEVHPEEASDGATSGANLLTVIEAPLPGDAAGKDAKLVMEATTAGEQGFRLAVPSLGICSARGR